MPAKSSAIVLPEVLASIGDSGFSEATLVTELSNGPVSRSWELDSPMGAVVLRVDMPLAAILQLDRAAEVDILGAAAVAGLGPELLWADPERGLLITRLLPGRIWNETDISSADNLIRLGALFSRLHSMPIARESQDLRTTLEIYTAAINTTRARSICASAENLLAELNADRGMTVFCHRDAHCGNIVDDGHLRLIDWEYAGSGDPCFDLAVVAQQHRLQSPQLDCLLDGYDGSPQPIDSKRLLQFCRLYDWLAELWRMLVTGGPLQGGRHSHIP